MRGGHNASLKHHKGACAAAIWTFDVIAATQPEQAPTKAVATTEACLLNFLAALSHIMAC